MLNRIILIGRLTQDPELKYTQSGHVVTTFTLAVDRPFSQKGKEKETDFIRVVAWEKLAETVAVYLRKGRLAAVEGRLQIRQYDNKEGQKVKAAEVVADNVRFLDRGDNGDGNGHVQTGNSNSRSAQSASQGGSGNRFNDDPFADNGNTIDISDDDLPW